MSRSILLEILKQRSARTLLDSTQAPEVVSADLPAFPFLAMVGQVEMKTALLLSVINPAIGGVLLIGPRGTGKTTAVRGLVDLMPPVRRSLCPYGCEEEAAETWGLDALCPDCAARMARGEELTGLERMRFVELPLNARLEDVVGGINERLAVEQQRVRLERGILAHAHRNLLYVDEVNLLDDFIVDAILDAAAQGRVVVRRGPLSALYPSSFVLVGSMNPEEGPLRPQIQDRFGLRVLVDGLADPGERLEVYRRVRLFREHPHRLAASLAAETVSFAEGVGRARDLLPSVQLSAEAESLALEMVRSLQIASHRAEITALEAARACAAADERTVATVEDVALVAPMAMRQRRSDFMEQYFEAARTEDREIQEACAAARKQVSP
ncbi:MAG: ATP-binding protein [Anaerolineae bacterium]|jgi:magnesium chelatase subunit I|nr:ATP-binding protein [Anaerolineae bacterium]